MSKINDKSSTRMPKDYGDLNMPSDKIVRKDIRDRLSKTLDKHLKEYGEQDEVNYYKKLISNYVDGYVTISKMSHPDIKPADMPDVSKLLLLDLKNYLDELKSEDVTFEQRWVKTNEARKFIGLIFGDVKSLNENKELNCHTEPGE